VLAHIALSRVATGARECVQVSDAGQELSRVCGTDFVLRSLVQTFDPLRKVDYHVLQRFEAISFMTS